MDEYQDCNLDQHNLVLMLANLMPVRIVADPLQGVFERMGADFDWNIHVAPNFDRLPDLSIPWRWKSKNADLGDWLQDVRGILVSGGTIDLRAAPITWVRATRPNQIKSCYRLLRVSKPETVIAIRRTRGQCSAIARSLRGTFTAMEEMDCLALRTACEAIGSQIEIARAKAVVTFASQCLTRVDWYLQQAVESYERRRYKLSIQA